MPPLRIFLSSPSDVFAERERAERVVQRLAGEYAGAVALEVVRWERSYYTAAQTFQDQIPPPAACDLVVCILWKRLGVTLPPAYARADGSLPTGTEYEFENALAAARATGRPDVLVYRKTAPVLLDAANLAHEQAQFDQLRAFWDRWFRSADGHFTAGFHSFEHADAFEAELEAHLRQWLVRRQAPETAEVAWPVALRGSPFRGLQPFDAAQATVFFGRRRVTERLRERLTDLSGTGLPFLLILGQSGAGKSSVLRAGLLPRLTQPGAVPGTDLWRAAVLRPSEGGGDPLLALCAALFAPDALPELAQGDSPTAAELAALMRAAPGAGARAVRLALDRAGAARAAAEGYERRLAARLLIGIDQLEEALALPAEPRAAFAAALLALARADGAAIWLVATLRSDFYAALQATPDLIALKEAGGQYDLLAPTAAEVAEIIAGPAQAAGLRYATRDGTGLDEALLAEAAPQGSLPLLQLALDALFEARDGTLLTWEAYDAFGGLRGVVEQRAEATLAALDQAAAAALPTVLAALVTIGDDGLVSSRAAPRAQAAPDAAAARLIDAFIAARLMVSDGTPGGAPDLGEASVRVAHEDPSVRVAHDAASVRVAHDAASVRVAHDALIAGWPRARAAIAADQALLAARARVEAAERVWTGAGCHPDDLLPPGRKLAEAAELAETRPDLLSPAAARFVAASRGAEAARQAAAQARAEHQLRLETEAAQARADAAQRVVRRTRIAVGIVSVLLVAAVGAALYAAAERRNALARSAEAERNFGLALDAGNAVTGAVFAHMRTGDLKIAAARDLLDRAARTFGTLAAVAGTGALAATADSGALADRQAALDSTLSDARLLIGDTAGALAAAEQARAIALRMAHGPDAEAWQRNLAVAERKVGAVQVRMGHLEEALAHYGASAAILTALLARQPDNPQWRRDLDIARDGTAGVLRAKGDREGALALYQLLLADAERAAAARPDDAEAQRDLDVSLESVADLMSDLGRHLMALDLYRRDLGIMERLLARDPGNTDWQLYTAISHERVGDALARTRQLPAATEQYRAAAALADVLAARDRDNSEWQDTDAIAHGRLGTAELDTGQNAAAAAELGTAADIYRRLSARDPGSQQWQRRMAVMLFDRGHALQRAGDTTAAFAAAREGIGILQRAAAASPDDINLLRALLVAHTTLSRMLTSVGDAAGAVAALRDRAAIAGQIADAAPTEVQARLTQAEAQNELGLALRRAHDIAGADAAFTAEDAVITPLAAAHPADPSMHTLLGFCRRNQAEVAIAQGQFTLGLTRLRESLHVWEALAAATPDNVRAVLEVAFVHARMAYVLARQNDPPAALKELRAAQDVVAAAQTRLPDNQELAQQRTLIDRMLAAVPPG